jgi:two-component system sensor histidine kinase/response regulator
MEAASPAGEETEKNESGSMADSNEPDVRAKTVLLVEDEEAHAELIHRTFEQNGSEWDIHHVVSIRDALKWLEENKKPSLVIADYRLPDGTGLDLAKGATSAEKVGFPLIILTGFGSERLAVRSLKSGAMDYIVKGAEGIHELPSTVERAIREWGNIIGLRRAEEEFGRYVKELERANQDLDDFAVTVSHDLKAPLRTIQAFSMLLMEDYADALDETGRGYLDKVRKAAERMSLLIEDLLKLSRVGRKFTELEKVDLNALLEEIKADLKVRIEERSGEVVVEKLPGIFTQRVWMKELLTNLIDNGLKFNKSDKPKVEISCEESEKSYLFKVKDDGIGIEEKYQANIFNLFERLHSQSEYEGTGAGLAICKKIVEELGGTIRVESKSVEEGSTFFFTIPKNFTQKE